MFNKLFAFFSVLANVASNKKYEARMKVIREMQEKYPTGKGLSWEDQITLVSLVIVSIMTGKLLGLVSISTLCLVNPICIARRKVKGSICEKCYAGQLKPTVIRALETNYIILNFFDISEKAWSTLKIGAPLGYVRIESFGDVASKMCATNYVRIIKSHKWLSFGIWTKNTNIWCSVFDMLGKPKNCTFVVSSPFLNTVMQVPEKFLKYVDHVFTVYTSDFVLANNVKINCGKYDGILQFSHDCKSCGLKCYKKNKKNYNISELLKNQAIDIKTKKGQMLAKKLGYNI